MKTKIKFVHEKRATQYLVKATGFNSDDLWILTNLEITATVVPTTKEKAMKILTPENGWTMVEEPLEWTLGNYSLNKDGTFIDGSKPSDPQNAWLHET